MTVDTSLPPALFDVEPVRRPRVLTPNSVPFTRWEDELCALCRKPLEKLRWSHGCGGASPEGRYVVCDDCAPDDLNPATGRSVWGITREFLAIDRMRRKVYAAGGGETEVHAALVAAGLAPVPCGLTWTDHHERVPHDVHACQFVTAVPHTRHECRCGLNRIEEPTDA